MRIRGGIRVYLLTLCPDAGSRDEADGLHGVVVAGNPFLSLILLLMPCNSLTSLSILVSFPRICSSDSSDDRIRMDGYLKREEEAGERRRKTMEKRTAAAAAAK